jgi:hypothetical protein
MNPSLNTDPIIARVAGEMTTPDGRTHPMRAAVSLVGEQTSVSHLEVPIAALVNGPYAYDGDELDLYMLDEFYTESINEGALEELDDDGVGYRLSQPITEAELAQKPIYLIGELNATQQPVATALSQGVVVTDNASVADWVASRLSNVVVHPSTVTPTEWHALAKQGALENDPAMALVKATVAHTREHGAFPEDASLRDLGKSVQQNLAKAFPATTAAKWAAAVSSPSAPNSAEALLNQVSAGEQLQQRARLDVAQQALRDHAQAVSLSDVDEALPLVPASGDVRIESLRLPVGETTVSATVYHVAAIHPDYGLPGRDQGEAYRPAAVVLNMGEGQAKIYQGPDVMPAIAPLIEEVRRHPVREHDAPDLGLSTPKLSPR